ncbi:ACP S-malonyltransferase, partial [Mammaliicoccus fleurettii]|nr:ACP S-malonyltransferase [Mammaliicoccus fleurettii]
MSKVAIMFPGQGSQKVGMAEDLYQKEINSTSILDRANESLSFDLLEIMFKDPEEILGLTEYTQPALLTHSSALMNALENLNYDFALGHSLGEYSALVSEGVLKFEDAVQIVHKRGTLMSEAFPQGVGSMAAVLGLNIDEVRAICEQLSTEDKLIEPANINCPGQIVVSGHSELIDKLVSEGKSLGAKRVMPLKVSGPFHSSMMKTIADDFENYINQFEWKDANHPIVQNVYA